MEEVLAARPDVVVLKDFLFGKYEEEFQKLGIPTIYLNLESPESWQEDLDTLGVLFDNPARARWLKEQFSSRQEAIQAALPPEAREEKKTALILYYSEKDGTGAFKVPPLTFIQTTMLRLAGGEPVWTDADLGTRWTKVGFEQIALWDPDQVFLISYRTPMEEVQRILGESPYWQELRALKEGEVHSFPIEFHSWDQPDPRWILGLEWLTSRIHPESIAPADMDRRAQEFFQSFYDISPEVYKNQIRPLIEGLDS